MTKERWIAHNQNGMPRRLKPDTLVNVAFRDVVFDLEPETVEWWSASWCLIDPEFRIIAYQIVED